MSLQKICPLPGAGVPPPPPLDPPALQLFTAPHVVAAPSEKVHAVEQSASALHTSVQRGNWAHAFFGQETSTKHPRAHHSHSVFWPCVNQRFGIFTVFS